MTFLLGLRVGPRAYEIKLDATMRNSLLETGVTEEIAQQLIQHGVCTKLYPGSEADTTIEILYQREIVVRPKVNGFQPPGTVQKGMQLEIVTIH